MAAGTKVQLRLGERVVAEVSFREDELRIGRMKENDLVINNLAVSRFHAVLRRVGEGYEIEDLGSENGTFVGGVQVKGRAALAAGAEIAIGKHTLSIRSGDDANLPALPARSSDAWDAGKTYVAPELAAARALAPAAPAARAPGVEPEVVVQALDDTGSGAPRFEPSAPAALEASAHDHPDPQGLFEFGEDELQLVPPAPATEPSPELVAAFDVAAPEPAPVAMAPGGQSALFDFGATDDLGLSERSLARVAAQRAAAAAEASPLATAAPPAAPEPAPAAASGHAGLIVERSGKVERVAPLRGAELIVGRGATCDLVLPTAGVSRRHARFVREGESVRVLDLGSANGLAVNGERTKERLLKVGDVVSIDDFTLTFVIDHEPLEAVVRSAPAPAAAPQPPHVTVLHDAPLAMMEEDVLLASDEDLAPLDAEKELESVAEAATPAPRAAAHPLAADWMVEVVVAAEELPAPLRDALAELGHGELKLPAKLRVRRRPGA